MFFTLIIYYSFYDTGLTTINLTSDNKLGYTRNDHDNKITFYGTAQVTLNFTETFSGQIEDK